MSNSLTTRRALLIIGMALTLGVTSVSSAAGSVTAAWTEPMPSIYYTGAMIGLDAADNVYIAGKLFNPNVIVTAKRDKFGALLWERQFDAPTTTYDEASWLAIDPSGNVIVAGTSIGGDGSDEDTVGWVLLKYDPNGNLLWSIATPYIRGRTVRVVTDASGNIYLTGRAWFGTDDMVLSKYAPGGSLLWTKTAGFDNFSADVPSALALAPNGDVVLVGGAVGWFLIDVYDSNGNLRWARTVSAGTGANDVAVNPSGEIYVVGGTYTPATGNQDLVLKYDANGNLIWSNTYLGYYGLRIASDSAGNLILTGVNTTGYLSWLTHKISPAGSLLWSQTYDNPTAGDEVPAFIVIGPDDAAYITGKGFPGSSGFYSMVTLKYLPDGTQDWSISTQQAAPGLAVRLGSDGSLFALGQSLMTVVHYVQGGTNQGPVAVISGYPSITYAPVTVNFSSVGSYDPDGTITAYAWDFGDGTISTAANPIHTYMLPGTYGVTLTVIDNGGLSNSAVMNIFALGCSLNCMRSTAITLQARGITTFTMNGRVTVKDAFNTAISGATVTATWTKPDGTTVAQTAVTNRNGLARFSLTGVGKGTTKLGINNITKVAYQFDPANSVLNASITK